MVIIDFEVAVGEQHKTDLLNRGMGHQNASAGFDRNLAGVGNRIAVYTAADRRKGD